MDRVQTKIPVTAVTDKHRSAHRAQQSCSRCLRSSSCSSTNPGQTLRASRPLPLTACPRAGADPTLPTATCPAAQELLCCWVR